MIADLKPYPSYKDSGVEWLGQVPAAWETVRLRQSVESVVAGVWGEEPDGLNDLACVRVADFDRDSHRVRMGTPTIRAVAPGDQSRRLLQSGDLLLEKSGGGEQQPVGFVALYDHEVPAVCSNFISRLRPTRAHDSAYLVYLHSVLYHRGLNVPAIKQTTGIQNLDGRAYLGQPVSFPLRPEQAAIARFLDHVDSRIQRFIAVKERLIELLEEEKQAIIHRAVTRGLDPNAPLKPSGVDWLGEIPEHWDIVPLRLRYSVKLGKMLDAKRITGVSLLSYLRNTDVQWDRINTDDLPEMDISPEERERYTVRPGDLLVCEGGEVGRAAIWGCSCIVGYQKALHRLRPCRPERDSPRFLYYVLRAMALRGIFKADGSESTIAHLTAEKLRRHRFPFPPSLEQRSIAETLDRELERREIVAATAGAHIALLREYRTRLISDVVTGKLDVREAARRLPNDPDADDAVLDERLEEAATA